MVHLRAGELQGAQWAHQADGHWRRAAGAMPTNPSRRPMFTGTVSPRVGRGDGKVQSWCPAVRRSPFEFALWISNAPCHTNFSSPSTWVAYTPPREKRGQRMDRIFPPNEQRKRSRAPSRGPWRVESSSPWGSVLRPYYYSQQPEVTARPKKMVFGGAKEGCPANCFACSWRWGDTRSTLFSISFPGAVNF
jgi:hypothetical protein